MSHLLCPLTSVLRAALESHTFLTPGWAPVSAQSTDLRWLLPVSTELVMFLQVPASSLPALRSHFLPDPRYSIDSRLCIHPLNVQVSRSPCARVPDVCDLCLLWHWWKAGHPKGPPMTFTGTLQHNSSTFLLLCLRALSGLAGPGCSQYDWM